jgi:hypothetical protein
MEIQIYCSWKRKTTDPLISTRHQRLNITLVGTSDGFLKLLQHEVLLFKILVLEHKFTMKKMPKNNRSSKKRRTRFPMKEKLLQNTHQPMPKAHGQWTSDVPLAIHILPLSDLIMSLNHLIL